MSDIRFEAPTAPMSAYVRPVRRDGKHIVEFVYPISGRRIRKLIATADLQAQTTDKGYALIYAR
jgi:hypothetical protein